MERRMIAGEEQDEAPPGGAAANQARGNLVRLVENGAWCWYQDERVIVDPRDETIYLGSTANRHGPGGETRDGDIDLTVFHPESGRIETRTVRRGLTSNGAGDDHNAPALWIRPDRGVLVVYAGHNNDYLSFYGVFRDGEWGGEKAFDWRTKPGGCDFPTTYSNLFYLEREKRLYNFARAHRRSPNFLISKDFGETWTYGGLLTRRPHDVGYVNGYFKYATNGIDRVHFVGTEHHPRDFDNSLYHGWISEGKSRRSDGGVVREDIADPGAPRVEEFTRMMNAGEVVGGSPMTHLWNLDIQCYPDGTIAVLFQARADGSVMDHRFLRAVFDGRDWQCEPLCAAGARLFPREEDYTGGGALDPLDPDVLYVSCPIDPRDGRPLEHHELFRGVRETNGWSWQPLTWNSERGNFRPVVVQRGKSGRGIFWWRGEMRSSQRYNTEIVGLLTER